MQQDPTDPQAAEIPGVTVRFRRFALWGAAAAVVLALAFACWWWLVRAPPLHYVTARVTRGDIQRSVSMTGALNPVVTAQVGSYVSGNIKSWSCDYNTLVKVGQSCALIDPLPFQVIVDQDEADVRTAIAQLAKDRAAVKNAELIYEHDAMVITRYIDVGQTVVSSLQSSTLFLIGKNMLKMQVDTNVSEADVGEVEAGQKATFTVQAFPNRTFVGKVRQIREGPITVQNVVTYDVVVDVPNEDFKLLPGMTADAHIITAERLNVLRVPLPAIRFTPEGLAHEAGEPGAEHAHRGSGEAPAAGPGGPGAQHGHGHAGRGAPRARVWVLRAAKLIPVQVRTGLDDGTLVEVAGEDLKEGDIVVVNAVRPNEPKPEGGERPPGANPYRPGAGAGGFRP